MPIPVLIFLLVFTATGFFALWSLLTMMSKSAQVWRELDAEFGLRRVWGGLFHDKREGLYHGRLFTLGQRWGMKVIVEIKMVVRNLDGRDLVIRHGGKDVTLGEPKSGVVVQSGDNEFDSFIAVASHDANFAQSLISSHIFRAKLVEMEYLDIQLKENELRFSLGTNLSDFDSKYVISALDSLNDIAMVVENFRATSLVLTNQEYAQPVHS